MDYLKMLKFRKLKWKTQNNKTYYIFYKKKLYDDKTMNVISNI